jgi:hypothetical protein
VDDVEPADFTLATMPARFARVGDRHAGIDDHPGSLEALLELSARHEREGMGDAPWPPQYKKAPGEPPRVQPSRRRKPGPEVPKFQGSKVPRSVRPTGRRTSKHPLLEIGRGQKKDEVLAGLERWKARYPEAASHLDPSDVLVDAMRGRFTTWTRIRVNLQHVPEALRPPQEAPDPDDVPEGYGGSYKLQVTSSKLGSKSQPRRKKRTPEP